MPKKIANDSNSIMNPPNSSHTDKYNNKIITSSGSELPKPVFSDSDKTINEMMKPSPSSETPKPVFSELDKQTNEEIKPSLSSETPKPVFKSTNKMIKLSHSLLEDRMQRLGPQLPSLLSVAPIETTPAQETTRLATTNNQGSNVSYPGLSQSSGEHKETNVVQQEAVGTKKPRVLR